MTSLIRLSSILIIVTVLISCSTPRDEISNVTNQYLEASKEMNVEIIYSLLSNEDKDIKSFESYTKEVNPIVISIRKFLFKKAQYDIVEVRENPGKAYVIVNGNVPDTELLMGEMMGSLFSQRQELGNFEDGQREISSQLKSKYQDQEIPMKKEIDTITLVKELEGWKIYLGWKIEKLLNEAKTAQADNDFVLAKNLYEQLIQMDSTNIIAKKNLQKVIAELRKIEEKLNYMEKISIYDLKAKYYNSLLDDWVPGVDFKIKNNGDKTLTKVEVTIYFKDSSGIVIYEQDYHPVLVTDFSFGDKKPLKPNYIWRNERDHFYSAKSVPEEWKVGSVEAKVTDIEFEED